MSRRPALLLLVALVGGLGSSWVHAAHHATEWADARAAHAASGAHSGGEHASQPCLGGDGSGLDCAVCAGLSGAIVEQTGLVDSPDPHERMRAADEAWAEVRRALSPARGPPESA